MLEDALDKEVDVLITQGATVTQTAIQITSRNGYADAGDLCFDAL